MIVMGAVTAKYQTEIYHFVTGDYKHVVERITNIGQTAKDFYTNRLISYL
jgi:hypothetical protein